MNKNELEELKEKYLGKTVRVNILDDWNPILNKTGIVEYVDDMGQLHGTWGGLAVIPDIDDIELV